MLNPHRFPWPGANIVYLDRFADAVFRLLLVFTTGCGVLALILRGMHPWLLATTVLLGLVVIADGLSWWRKHRRNPVGPAALAAWRNLDLTIQRWPANTLLQHQQDVFVVVRHRRLRWWEERGIDHLRCDDDGYVRLRRYTLEQPGRVRRIFQLGVISEEGLMVPVDVPKPRWRRVRRWLAHTGVEVADVPELIVLVRTLQNSRDRGVATPSQAPCPHKQEGPNS